MNPSNRNAETKQFLDSYEKLLHTFSLPERISGQYTLLSCIKHSQNKEIYLLSDKQEHFYILKKEKNNGTARIRREHQIFEMLNASDEPAPIPKCIDYWEDADWCFLLRTYIEGDSLAAYADRHPSLSSREIIDLSLAICRLIKLFHDRKPPVIHRDIKPENFVLQKDTHVLYLIDFDTARQYIPEKTRDTQLFGTPDLAAPEQFGFIQSDVRTDIYGIGKTMLCLITGSAAEEGLQDKSIPAGLRKIIRRAAAFSPEKRYPNIAALQRDLEKYKRQLSFAVPLRRAAIGILLFSLGIGFGFIGGKHYQTQLPATADKTAGTDDGSLSGQTAAMLEEAHSSSDSLLSITGVKQVDLWQYQNQLDAIVLSYCNADYDDMIGQLEVLVRDLYADDALMQVLGEDYSGCEYMPEDFWMLNELARIRIRLAYRDQLLQKRLGSYKDYQKNIIIMFDDTLSLVEGNGEPNCLFQYATAAAQERNIYYEYAIADLLWAVCSGIDISDGFTHPK